MNNFILDLLFIALVECLPLCSVLYLHICGWGKTNKNPSLFAVCLSLQGPIQLYFGTYLYFSVSRPFRHKKLPIPLGKLLISSVLSEAVIYLVRSGTIPYKIFPLIKMQVPDSFHTFDLKKFHAFSTLKSLSSLIQLTSLTSFLNFSKFIFLKLRSFTSLVAAVLLGAAAAFQGSCCADTLLGAHVSTVVLMRKVAGFPPPPPSYCSSA